MMQRQNVMEFNIIKTISNAKTQEKDILIKLWKEI